MMAEKSPGKAMLDEPCGAARTLEAVAASAAQGQRRVAAAIEEQQRLLTRLERRGQFADQWRRQKTSAVEAFAAQIDEPHEREFGGRVTPRQRDPLVSAARD